MAKNTTINLRVDSEVKQQAGEILDSLGLTLSEAFNLMLHQVRIVRGLPFEVKHHLPEATRPKPKAETLALIERIESGEEELVGPFLSKEELWRSLGI